MTLFKLSSLVEKYHNISFAVYGVAFAQILNYPKDIIDTPEKIVDLTETIRDWVFTVFMIVAVIAIIYTAFMYLTAAGSEDKVKKARMALTFAIVAIVIALLAGSLPTLIQNIIGDGSGAESNNDVSDQRNPLNVDPNNTDIQPR